jgi:hypothetical protein
LIKQGILIERKRFKMRNYFLILLLLPQLVFAQKMDLDADFGGSLPSIRSRPVTKSSAEKESVSYYCSLELDRELKHNWIVSLGLDMYQIKTRIHNVYEPKAIVTKQYFAGGAMPLHLSRQECDNYYDYFSHICFFFTVRLASVFCAVVPKGFVICYFI